MKRRRGSQGNKTNLFRGTPSNVRNYPKSRDYSGYVRKNSDSRQEMVRERGGKANQSFNRAGTERERSVHGDRHAGTEGYREYDDDVDYSDTITSRIANKITSREGEKGKTVTCNSLTFKPCEKRGRYRNVKTGEYKDVS